MRTPLPRIEISRRSLLVALTTLPLTGCTADSLAAHQTATARPRSEVTATPRGPVQLDRDADFQTLETQFDALLGVWAYDTGSAVQISYRTEERFAFCSTGKAFLAAMILNTHTPQQMETLIHYSQADLIAHSPISTQNLSSGMTLTQLCDAAVRYSDNTAANLLYAQIGGPAQLQSFMCGLGDAVTNMDRTEPFLSYAVPGDLRDTTTPQQWGSDFKSLVLGDVLRETQRSTLVDWLQHNTTGATMIRKAVPTAWAVADKTGTGWYGTRNDIAVIWPTGRKPWIMAIMSSRTTKDATINDDLLAQAATLISHAYA